MNQTVEEIPKACTSCGGELTRISPYEYQCTSCGRKYYVSGDKLHKVSVRLSMGQIVLIVIACTLILGTGAVLGYEYYTSHLVASASRFSVTFRDFLMEVYDKPIADIKEEDLSKIQFLRIEKDGKKYIFTYSFEDYYDYPDEDQFEKTTQSVSIEAGKDDFSPTNVQYFVGLTRVELYTEAWENYILPEENVIKGILCTDGLSKYGTPEFFNRVNPDTLEEVMILGADSLEDYSFMENIKGVKGLLLENAKLKNVDMFKGFDRLEHLVLYYVEIDEEDAYEYVKELISLPSLKAFAITGKSGWYVTDEEWEGLEKEYEGKVVLIRQ